MEHRLFFEATSRNSDPIAEVLQDNLPKKGIVLEVASGSGQHAVTFQKRFPLLNWQASEPDPINRKSIDSWISHQGLTRKMNAPLNLDVEIRPWNLPNLVVSNLIAIVCINMLHVSNWECSKALIAESSILLKSGQPLIIYGPFKHKNNHTSPSNAIFEEHLRSRNKHWGIRDIEKINEIAYQNKFKKIEIINMPANNFMLILKS